MKFLAVVLSSLMLVACGGGGGSGVTAPPVTNPVSTTASASIGPAGGTVQTSNGVIRVDLPANSLSSTQQISISTASTATPPGNVGNVVLTLGPDGTTFAKSVKIQVKYDPLSLSPSMTENDLTLAYAEANKWNSIPTVVDTVNKTLTGETTHFSTYGITLSATTKKPYGTFLGNVNGVAVYSNGCLDPSTADCGSHPDTYNTNNAGSYNTGLMWQCVEFVNRYYLQQYGLQIRIPGENANQYYVNAAARGLLRYPNGGAEGPRVGDILVSDVGKFGHVAIITRVLANTVYYAQQNFTEGPADLESSMPLSPINGNFTLGGFSPSYPVVGWVRSPASTAAPVTQITASRIPTSGYTVADGKLASNFNSFDDVWVSPAAVVVAGDYVMGVSDDSGATWSGVDTACLGHTAISPGVILEGGGDGCLLRHTRTKPGVWTTEALTGLTFIHPTLGAPYHLNILSLAYFESNFFALMSDMDSQTEGSIYKSADGASWSKQGYRFNINCSLRNMERTIDGRIQACGKTSKDNGIAWTYLPYDGDTIKPIFLNIGDTGIMIKDGQSVYQSTDNGVSYTQVNSNLNTVIGNWTPMLPGSSLGSLSGSPRIVQAAVVGTDVVMISYDYMAFGSGITTRILRSADKGKTWVPSSAGFLHSDAWMELTFRRMAVIGSDLYFVISGHNGNSGSVLYQSHDGGRNWSIGLRADVSSTVELWSEDGQCYRNDLVKGQIVDGIPSTTYTARSSTDGINWTPIGSGQFTRDMDSKGTRLRRVDPAYVSNGVLKEFVSSIEKFDEKTGNWRTVLTSSKPTLATYPTGIDGTFYVGFRSISQLFKSVDAGETWQQVTNTSMPPYVAKILALGNRTLLAVNGPLSCIGGNCVPDPGYVQGVFISRDEGVTWTAVPDFQLPANTIFGNGVVLGARIGLPGLIRYESPYVNTTLVDPLMVDTSSFRQLMFEENTFITSTGDGTLGISDDGGLNWQTVRLDVSGQISGVGVCGGRLLLNQNGGIVYSPKL